MAAAGADLVERAGGAFDRVPGVVPHRDERWRGDGPSLGVEQRGDGLHTRGAERMLSKAARKSQMDERLL